MAQEGVILPREPLFLVDKQWRIGQASMSKTTSKASPNDRSNLKVQVLGRTHGTGSRTNANQSDVFGKQHNFRFVQSCHNTQVAGKKLSQRRRRSLENSTAETTSTPESGVSAIAADIRIGSLPSGSSSAFYGHLEENLAVRYSELLKYYPTTITNSFYPLRSKLAFDMNPMGSVWLSLALGDEALLRTVMLSSAVQIASFNPTAYDEIMQRLSRSAIEIVSGRMKSNTLTDATIGAVSCMVLIELSMGRPQHSGMHHAGLLEVIRQRGGIKSIDPSLQMKIYRAALLPAVDNLERPRLPRLRPSVPPLHATLQMARTQEQQYSAMLAQSGLDLDVIDILLAMWQFSNAVDYAMVHATTINQQAFDEDTMNIFHDLASRSNDTLSALNNACRYAAIIYMNTLTRENPFLQAVCEKVSHALKAEVERLDGDHYTNAVENVMLWVVFMGCLASSFTQERLWFRRRLSSLTEILGVADWTACQQRLQSICWIDRIHDEYGVALWNEIQQLSRPTPLSGFEPDIDMPPQKT